MAKSSESDLRWAGRRRGERARVINTSFAMAGRRCVRPPCKTAENAVCDDGIKSRRRGLNLPSGDCITHASLSVPANLGLPSLLNCFNTVSKEARNAQTENQEQRQKALLSHRHRQSPGEPGWQAAWNDQADQQADPQSARHDDPVGSGCAYRQEISAVRLRRESNGTC